MELVHNLPPRMHFVLNCEVLIVSTNYCTLDDQPLLPKVCKVPGLLVVLEPLSNKGC